jgi:hypothetical protein
MKFEFIILPNPRYSIISHFRRLSRITLKKLNANDKETMTVFASITAARTKLPLQFVPRGRTDELQPRDWYVFGILKAMCRRMFHRFIEIVNGTLRKPTAVEFMCKAWAKVQENVIRKAWGIYEEPYDSSELTDEEIFEDET